jgi:hypothetical protein
MPEIKDHLLNSPQHSPCRHHIIRWCNADPVSVLKPFAMDHHITHAVFFNKFLAVDILGTIILIEKTTFFKQVAFFHRTLNFTKDTKNLGK